MSFGDILLLRADASSRMGTGHVMRCLALAHAWEAGGGRAVFVLANAPEALAARVEEAFVVLRCHAEPGSLADATQTAAFAQQCRAGQIVIDGYQFGADYQEQIVAAGPRLLVVDDYAHAEQYSADLLLNQNLYAAESMYQGRAPGTRLLLGVRFALLRPEFQPWRTWQRQRRDQARQVLVTFGGSDPCNQTLKAIQALSLLGRDNLEARVLVGVANPHREALEAAAASSPAAIQVLNDVRDMPAQLAWAELAISAAGSTCWEMLFMGLPLVVMSVAENQRPIAESLQAHKVGLNAGWHADITAEALATALAGLLDNQSARRAMTARGRAMVDGLGAERVAAALRAVG